MGFFTLPLARRVGPTGRVVAVDVQPKMIASLKRRIAHAGLLSRVDARVVAPDTMGLTDLAGAVDFTLAFALVHELPAVEPFFGEIARASKPGARLLFVEPAGHVKLPDFEAELQAAAKEGFELVDRPAIRRSHAGLLKKG
jgi:SAM-dependent methyltransferase